MRVLLVGGGKVGSYLAHELSKDGHVVTVIEGVPERARELSEDSSILVFEGDGTEVELLTAADVDRADWALGVTGLDEVNLVACQLALTLGAKRVLARLNNPRNRPTFDALGIPVVAVTDLMGQVITSEVEIDHLARVAVIGGGRLSVCEIEIPEGFPECALAELEFPQPAVLAAVLRAGEAEVPSATTRLRPGDRVTAVTTLENETELRDALSGAGDGGDEPRDDT
jgi:trk system potassium uptake protein TrkA